MRGLVYGRDRLMMRARLLGQHGRNSRPLHQAIAEEFRHEFVRNHLAGGTTLPVGRWAPLAPSTLRRKGRLSSQPLIDKGAMLSMWRSRATTGYAHIENTEPYALFHQKGTRRMPARRLLPSDSYMLAWALDIVRRLFGFVPGRLGVRSV